MKKIIIGSMIFVCIFTALRCLGITYPMGRITIQVLGEDTKPIENASASLWYTRLKTANPWDGQEYHTIKGVTDSQGLFSATYTGLTKLNYNSSKEGFYSNSGKFTMTDDDGVRWLPWDPTVTLRLREIRKPIAMYAKGFNPLSLPAEETGYDLIKGDFTSPYGKGEVADCIFSLEAIEVPISDTTNTFWQASRFCLTFPGDFNGIEAVYEKDLVRESDFIWPYEAVNDGYAMKQVDWRLSEERVEGRRIFSKAPDADTLFFRIRATKNPDGSFKSAFYGKMVLPREVRVFYDERKKIMDRTLTGLRFYVNPTPNDRNMEFDITNNLLYTNRMHVGNNIWVVNPHSYKTGEYEIAQP